MPTMLARPIREEAWRQRASRRNGLSAISAPRNSFQNSADDVGDAGPWEPAVRVLVEFQHLGDDWDGQGARPPSRELLASAIGLAYTLHEQGVDPPSRVVPGLEGSVIFEWQDPDGTYTEVEIDRPLHAEVMLMEPGQAVKHWTLPTE
ncbi:MAG: hypothetical protein HYS12_10820 [Planctomycetes bacterium]|nr:hypothetical protein [Planctomycetota bacterium]